MSEAWVTWVNETRDEVAKQFGWSVLEADADHLKVEMRRTALSTVPKGHFYGIALAAFAQRVAALIAAYQPEVPASTLPTSLVTQMNLNLISNSRGERVVAEAHWLSHNGRQWVSETEVRDDTGHLVLQCTSTHVPLA